MDDSLLICTATALEDGLLRAALGENGGRVGGVFVRLVRTGVGPVRAASAVTRALLERPSARVVICGVGGAYPGSGLQVLDVACAASEQFADLGAETPDGFLHASDLGFAERMYPLEIDLGGRRVPFVTRATCTGTDATARLMVNRTGGAVESMEGAAVVEIAREFGSLCGELRGISNPVGDRDRDKWRLQEAADAAQRSLLAWIESC